MEHIPRLNVAPEEPPAGIAAVAGDFIRQRDYVTRYLTWLRVPKSAVDELTQDVFLVAHRRRGEFRGESSTKTWLSGIAFHLVLNWRRRLRWRQLWEHSDSGEYSAPRSDATTTRNAMDELLVKELCTGVAKVLEEQSEVARRLWLMVVFEDTAVSRAGMTLGLTEYQAQQVFTKTQQRLQHLLARRERAG